VWDVLWWAVLEIISVPLVTLDGLYYFFIYLPISKSCGASPNQLNTSPSSGLHPFYQIGRLWLPNYSGITVRPYINAGRSTDT
jgi:hypothetical protein